MAGSDKTREAAQQRDGDTGATYEPADHSSGGGISGVSIRRPVFTTMCMLALVVLGIFGFRQLPIDQFPDIDIPVVVVQTIYPGGSPESVEREITRRLEEAFNPVEGVDNITSISLEGVSQVIVEFDLERDGDQAAQDIRAAIDGVRQELPIDIEAPLVQKFDPAALPIMSLALSSENLTISELTALADEDLRRALESVSGVGRVQLAGGLEREIRVYLDPTRMEALGVPTQQVIAALQQQNMEVPAGRLTREGREQLVRVTGRLVDPSQFEEIFIANRQGRPVQLRDVARVEDATEDERSLALVDGNRAVALDVQKVSGANTVSVADEVHEAIAEISATLPEGTQLQVIRDNSVQIRQSVDDALHELMLGALLTVIIVMLFLNDWKATVITSLVLPVSVISAFLMMNMMGFTINMLTLMALSLSIGILIDDAIIVIENIVRHREMGRDHFSAAFDGTREIFLAVVATTFSIVAVFVPVAFMGGIIGRFFFEFGLTVAFAVLVSLLVSFTLTPMLSAWWGVNPHGGGEPGNPITRGIAAFNQWFDRQSKRYRGVIEWALGHRKSVLGIAAASLVATFMLLPFIGGGFFPLADNSEFTITFETPEGSSLAYTHGKADQIEQSLQEIEGIDYIYTTVGAGATGTVNSGEVFVKMVPASERNTSQFEAMDQAREKLTQIFGLNVQVLESSGMGGAQAPLQVEIRGPDVDELQRLSDELMPVVAGIPGVVDVRSSLGQPQPEFRIEVDRNVANELGIDVGQVAAVVRPVLAGLDVTRWEDPSGEERDVVLQIAPERRMSMSDISTLPIATSQMTEDGRVITVPLGQIATIERGFAPSQIDRAGLQRQASISASAAGGLSIQEASQAITQSIAEVELPPGYSVRLGGETEQLAETVGYVVEAILLAVILIFLILASQFESFTQPFAIMMSLPLSLVGVLIALFLTDDTLNMMSMIGVIMLMGLVTKNAILLVDNANERRRLGHDRWSALVEAGQVRLRPIIMTTLAMIFGMLPVALGLGEGGGFRAPMARAVIGGLITSTMLTLIVVPVVYTYVDDFGAWVKSKLVSPERARELEREQRESGMVTEATAWGD